MVLLLLQGIVAAIMLVIEIGQFCRSTKAYLSSIWNLTDLAYVAILAAQMFFRFLFINKSIIADWNELNELKTEEEV
jgi:hypothetical protein